MGICIGSSDGFGISRLKCDAGEASPDPVPLMLSHVPPMSNMKGTRR